MSVVAAYVVPHPPLIVPAVGQGKEEAIQATIDAYQQVARRVAAHHPDTIVVASPHAPLYADCFYVSTADILRGDLREFGALEAALTVPMDGAFAAAVAACARKHDAAVCGSGMQEALLDHATLIPLHFVQEVYGDYQLVHVGISELSARAHVALGRCIAEAAQDLNRRCVFIASGDLSHKLLPDGPYGFAPEGPVFDHAVTALLDAGDVRGLTEIDENLAQAAAECGLRSLWIMSGVLEGLPTTHELLSYEGPFGVGYAVAAFEVQGARGDGAVTSAVDAFEGARDAADAAANAGAVDPYVALARQAVERYVRTGQPLELPERMPPELVEERAGVFVSLHEHDQLRGCIGTVDPVTGSVAEEIARNAVLAATQDPRFSPVSVDELDELSYSVDVLLTPQPIYSIAALDPAHYGVIVQKDRKSGLLLPNLEGVTTAEQQLAIAKQKAGIAEDDTQVDLFRFEVVRHSRGGEARA